MNAVGNAGPTQDCVRITVEFTDVYDGSEYVRVETFDVLAPAGDDEDLLAWADEYLFPLTGDGKHVAADAGYFARVTACPRRSDLVGREFDWGC